MEEGSGTFRCHGIPGCPNRINASAILDAIADRKSIDIKYAIITGDLDVRQRDYQLESDENGMLFVEGRIKIQYSEIIGNANFIKINFSGEVNFTRTDFRGISDFGEAKISGIPFFTGTRFSEDPNLSEAELEIAPGSFNSIGWAYRKSALFGAGYFFERAGKSYWDRGDYSKASESFRNAKVEYEKEGKYREAGKMYIKEMDSTRKVLKAEAGSPIKRIRSCMKCIVYWMWKITCNYGETPLRFTGWVVFIVVLFAIVYMPIMPSKFSSWPSWACIAFKEYPYYKGNNFLTALYFSVVTFATLGFGDITPVSGAGRISVITEVLLGYVMFGMLITLVARKMTRS